MKTVLIVSLVVIVVFFLIILITEELSGKDALIGSSIIGSIVFVIGFLGWLSQFPVIGMIMEIFWTLLVLLLIGYGIKLLLKRLFNLNGKMILFVIGILFAIWISSHFHGNPNETRANPWGEYNPMPETFRL